MKKVRLIVFGALCAGLAVNLLAQENLTRPVSVVPTVEPVNKESESPIESVILSSIVQELTQEGFIARTEESGPRPKGDYYITAIYEADGAAIGLEISASQRRQGSAIVTASWEGELSMTTDVEIQELIRNEILPEFPRSIEVTQSEVDDAASEGEEWALALIAETAANDLFPQRFQRVEDPWRVDTGIHVITILGSDFENYDTGIGVRVSAGYAFKIGQFELQPGLVTGYQYLEYNGFDLDTSKLGISDEKALELDGLMRSQDQDDHKSYYREISDLAKKAKPVLIASAAGDNFIIPFAVEFKTAYLGLNKVQPYFRMAVGGAWHRLKKDEKITLTENFTVNNVILSAESAGISPHDGSFKKLRFLLQTGLGAEYQFLPYLGAYADTAALLYELKRMLTRM